MYLYHTPGHRDGAVTDFSFVDRRPLLPNLLINEHPHEDLLSNSTSPLMLTESSLQRYDAKRKVNSSRRRWQLIISVGRDGQCLLQNFNKGERPILQVPSSTFALANLSPFQPGFGSLQIMAVHQKVHAPSVLPEDDAYILPTSKSDLVFSVTDSGDVKDLSSSTLQECVDVAPEVVSAFLSNFKSPTSILSQYLITTSSTIIPDAPF